MRPLCRARPNRIESLAARAHLWNRRNERGACMLDLLIIVCGTGGIVLMAAYAALCERI
jgi:hypothetical protein